MDTSTVAPARSLAGDTVCVKFRDSGALDPQVLPERDGFGELAARRLDVGALAPQIVGDGAPQGRIGDMMGRIGHDRNIAPRDLVLALRPGFDPGKPMRNRIFDGLIITQLKVEERVMLDGAPMASIERMGADEIDGTGNETSRPSGHDQENAIGHGLADERIELAAQIRAAPFARAGLHVEGEERVPYGFGQIRSRKPNHVDAGWERVAPLAADDLSLARGERGQEIVERAIGRIEPVELLIIALQEPMPAEQPPFRLAREGDVDGRRIPQPA